MRKFITKLLGHKPGADAEAAADAAQIMLLARVARVSAPTPPPAAKG
jgi:hypothetical protein